MGSKRVMLQNGFGHAILSAAKSSERVVDLFSGSGVVSWYAAEHLNQPVLAVDLQTYSGVLAGAIIGRTRNLNVAKLTDGWLETARRSARRCVGWKPAGEFDRPRFKRDVLAARALCEEHEGGMIWSAYGGHYFSPRQALLLDRALAHLPQRNPDRTACRAALIAAAGYCAAAPGHTAQPFRPSRSSVPYIREFWRRDPISYAENWLTEISRRHARVLGRARVGDAVEEATQLRPGDLVIIDPPYSAVQYSRFYHVLEAIARFEGGCGEAVSGVGRYPPFETRPRSDFSIKTRSQGAIEDLLGSIGEVGCTAIVTFPKGRASNGLSGAQIARLARPDFEVKTETVKGRFSTLGGNGATRAARQASAEMIITLRAG